MKCLQLQVYLLMESLQLFFIVETFVPTSNSSLEKVEMLET